MDSDVEDEDAGLDKKMDSEKTLSESNENIDSKPPVTGFRQDKAMLCNLILMACFWTASSFCYYIMTFYLKYIPGSIYVNTTMASTAQCLGHLVSGIILTIFGVKIAFMISFILASVGGILLVIFFNAEGALIATFVLFAEFGICFAFNLVYIATPMMFPTALAATAYGICNIFARFFTIMSPLIAELPDPAPMSIFTIVCIVSAILPPFLRKVKKDN